MTGAQPRLIPFVIVGLAALASVKIGGGLFGITKADAQTPPTVETTLEPEVSTRADAPPPQAPVGEIERRMLERLAERRRMLDEREQDLVLREAVIAAAQAKLARQTETFERERAEIIALRDQRDAAADEDIQSLVSAYERMKARDAAEIFNALEDSVMLSVASNMRTQALAGILAEMAPDKARTLTVKLAERGRMIDEDGRDGAP